MIEENRIGQEVLILSLSLALTHTYTVTHTQLLRRKEVECIHLSLRINKKNNSLYEVNEELSSRRRSG